MVIARKYYIRGLVQGVGFRFFAQRAAARHQVLGYVKNLPDGRVEAYAEGDQQSLKDFQDDLTAGPSFSRVEDVEEIVLEPNGRYKSFLIER